MFNLSPFALERFPIGWNHSIEKKTLQINKLEHVLKSENADISKFENIGKVIQLFRNMLEKARATQA